MIAIGGGIVRGVLASQEFLWLDELHTSWAVGDSLQDVFNRSTHGNQSPLYFWLSWIPVAFMGEAPFTIRFVSLIAGIGTAFIGSMLVLNWTRSTLGAVVVAILITLDLQFIYYGTEARPYSLVQLISVVQVMLFWQWIELKSGMNETECKPNSLNPACNPTLAASCLVMTSALLIYTHYTSIWLILTEVGFVGTWLILSEEFRRRIWRSSLLTVSSFTLLCLPALLLMYSVFARRGNWAPVSSIRTVLDEFLRFSVSQTSPFLIWLVLPLIVLCIAGLSGRFLRLKSPSDLPPNAFQKLKLCFVILWATTPVLAVISIDFSGIAPTALTRYTLVGSAAFPIFAGLAIGVCEDRKFQMGLGIVLISTSLIQSPITSGNYITSGFTSSELPGLRFEDWETPIEFINADQSKRDQPIFLAANLIEDVDAFTNRAPTFQEYLLFPLKGLYSVEPKRDLIPIPTLLREHFEDQHLRRIKKAGGAWVIIRGTEELVTEIEAEIQGKAELLDPQAKLVVKLHGSLNSYVYLLSIDW